MWLTIIKLTKIRLPFRRLPRQILNTIHIVLDKKPPGRLVTVTDLHLQYEGDCRTESVKEKLKEKWIRTAGVAQAEVFCGKESRKAPNFSDHINTFFKT